MLSLDVIEDVSPRVHPSQLSLEEREKRKREYAEESSRREEKRREEKRNDRDSILFSPSTSYITAETEIKTLITELEDAVLVGLHTCGDLIPSTLRMFRAKQELCAVCSVSCCYTCSLKSLIRTDRALERVSAGGELPMESLFYRTVLHVFLWDYYDSF
ncbi:methyltransferase-like protein 25 isoform X2 [Cyprinus carpio]|uniref:Methyltransferase-like protein 25 isoform X2 n=1 Tax=Cyprinus carpio TaxID=7962 RepID=A0A9Q9XLK2_CYPCA|nr:methyltransferase-like protein 25 isoform X2 [Cyprinus carpio]